MDYATVRGLGTVFAMIAFIGVCLWAYSARRKSDFDEAANLPFKEDNDTNSQRGNNHD